MPLALKDLQVIRQRIRSDTKTLLHEITTILRELGYGPPTPLRSTTAKRISTGLIPRSAPPVGTYTCEICRRSFRYLMHLGRHKQIAHPPAKSLTKEKARP